MRFRGAKFPRSLNSEFGCHTLMHLRTIKLPATTHVTTPYPHLVSGRAANADECSVLMTYSHTPTSTVGVRPVGSRELEVEFSRRATGSQVRAWLTVTADARGQCRRKALPSLLSRQLVSVKECANRKRPISSFAYLGFSCIISCRIKSFKSDVEKLSNADQEEEVRENRGFPRSKPKQKFVITESRVIHNPALLCLRRVWYHSRGHIRRIFFVNFSPEKRLTLIKLHVFFGSYLEDIFLLPR